MAGNLMPFGTRTYVGMVPCPLVPFTRTVTRTRTEYPMSNGAVLVKSARMPRRKFDFTWMDKLVNLQQVVEMGLENSGPPYYFLDPGILSNGWNALPAHWSDPGRLMNANGASAADFVGQYAMINRNFGTMSDGAFATPGAYVTAIGCPTSGVRFTIPAPVTGLGPYQIKLQSSGGVQPYFMDSGILKATAVSANILVPPNYKLTLRVTQDADPGASVNVAWRTAGPDGRFSTVWSVTPTFVGTADGVTVLTPITNNATTWASADIWIGQSAVTGVGGVLTLYGLEAYVLPTAGTIPATFQKGRGSMPLWPADDDISISVYGVALADARKMHGVTWSMMEGDIPW